MSWCNIDNYRWQKPYRVARLGIFIALIGTFFLASDFVIQLVSHWQNGFDSVSILTKAMADDDDDGGGGESRSSGRSESRSSDRGESRSSRSSRGRSSERDHDDDDDRGLSASFKSRSSKDDDDDRDHRGSSSRSGNDDDDDDDDDHRDSSSRSGNDDDDDDDDDFDVDDGILKNLGKAFKRLTGEGKSKRSRGSGRRFYQPRARNEILAVNLGRNGAKNARGLGFKVGGSNRFSYLPGRVTRLVPPRNLTGPQARDLLKRAQPKGKFSVNQRYKFYQPALKNEREENGQTEPAQYGAGTVCDATKCFGRQVIRWQEDIQTCSKGLRVGIIDTQVDHQHPAFSKADIHLGGFLPYGMKSAPAWHGTGVLSVLAGDPNSGTPGLIPQATFFVANVFFMDNEGEVETDTLSILDALEWMSAFGVKVINMSFSGPKDELVEEAIDRMRQEGVIFVAAAGNDGPTAEPAYPASYSSVIAVTAVSKDLRNYPYASRGNNLDAAAPGVNIWSAVPNGREGFHTGTSFAAPHVAAMLASIYEDAKRVQNKEELLNRLSMVDLGPPGRDPIYGRGLMLAPTSCNNANGGRIAQETPPVLVKTPVKSKRPLFTVGQSGGVSSHAKSSGVSLSYR